MSSPSASFSIRRLRSGAGAMLMGAVGNAGLNATSFAMNAITAILLSRLLGAEGYGIYAFALAWAMLLAVPAVLGLPSLVVREIATYRVQEAWAEVKGVIRRSNQAVIAASIAACLGFAFVALLSGWPPGRLFRPTLLALPLVPLIVLISLRQSAMQGFGRVVLGRVPEAFIGPLLGLVLMASLYAVLGKRFTAAWAIAATVIGVAVAAVAGVVLLRRTTPRSVREARPVFANRAWLTSAAPLFAIAVIQSANTQIGVVVVGAVKGSRETGIFSVANRASALIGFLLVATVPTLMPTIANLRARNASERLQQTISHSARRVFIATLPLAVVIMVFSRPVLSIFGPDFQAASTALRILCVGQIVNVATGFVGTILMMIDRAGEVTVGAAIGAAINVTLCIALVPSLGAVGAAAAAATGLSVTNVFLTVRLWRREGLYSPAIGLGMLSR